MMVAVSFNSIIRVLKFVLIIGVPIVVAALLLNAIDAFDKRMGVVVSIGFFLTLLVIGYVSGRRVD